MTQVAKPRTIIPKNRFRIEIDNVGDVRALSVQSLKTVFAIIETEEGGASTTAELTSNTYKYDPLTVERPLTEDDGLALWVENVKRGVQDRRNGAIYALDPQGNDFYRWDLEEISVASYEEFAGDAKGGKEEQMMERIELRYRERGMRVRVQ